MHPTMSYGGVQLPWMRKSLGPWVEPPTLRKLAGKYRFIKESDPEKARACRGDGSESRKRKYLFGEGDFPPAKRQKLMAWVSKRFQERCREYHERKRKILIGLTLYWDTKMRDARRMACKRPSSEVYAEYEGFLMAKYAKLVLEPPTAAHLTTPVTSAANKVAELEAVIASVETAVTPAVEAEIEAAKTSAVETAAKMKADVKDEVSVPPQKRRLIKRLPENVEEREATESKEVTVPRRKRWRRKGEKRS